MVSNQNLELEAIVEAEPRNPLTNRDFLLLWFGESVSLFGDQFYMIALPWLVLQLTGNALALGTVLAFVGIPRALFMLVGGAITDRVSPRKVMLVSNFIRMILVVMLTGLVLTETIELWMLYGFALFFGLADAFFFPAQSAIVPQILDDKQLQTGNSIVQGTAQLSIVLGPILAGLIIGGMGEAPEVLESGLAAEAVPNMAGIGIAFAIDAATFLVSLAALWFIRLNKKNDDNTSEEGVITAIRSGLSYVWNDPILKPLFLLIAGINFLVTGPFAVGVPVLADSRLSEGATAFGMIMAAYGSGSLLGIILAGTLPKPPAQRLGTILLVIISVLGLMVASLGFITDTLGAAIAMSIAGLADGYVLILMITWLQKRTPETMLGRMMSLLMFASVGLGPVSQTIAGLLIEIDLNAMFIGSGLLMTALTLWAATLPSLRAMGIETEAENETQTTTPVDLRRTAELPVAD